MVPLQKAVFKMIIQFAAKSLYVIIKKG